MAHYDVPQVLPDTAMSRELIAERLAYFKLFDAALDVKCEILMWSADHPHALPVLTDWARDNGRSLTPRHHEARDDDGLHVHGMTVWSVSLGNGSEISYYLVRK